MTNFPDALPSRRELWLRKLYSGAGLLGLALLLLAGVALLAPLDQWRVDLTEGKLYTLSPGSRNIVAQLPQPVTLRFYHSESLTREIPTLRNYAQRVEELLREYQRAGHGRIVLDVIQPELFSEEEDQAAAAGLQGVPNGQGENIYLGLEGVRGEQHERIAFFNPQKEDQLEYEISQLIYRLGRPAPVTVGVISGLPVFRSLDYRTNRPRPAWLVMDQLQQLFDVRRQLDNDIEKVDDDLNLLIVIHPNSLPERTLFALDQFVLRGGKLLVFVDPLAETDESEASMMSEGFADRSSTLDVLFDTWGVAFDPTKVVLDLGYAHSIPVQQYGREVPHLGVLGLHDEAINRTQNVIADLEYINLSSAGSLSAKTGASTTFVPLLSSSNQTQLLDSQQYSLIGTHDKLLQQFKPDNTRYCFAALVSGVVKSAFPQGVPASVKAADIVPLQQSAQPVSIMVVADTDVLTDRLWVERQDFYGQAMATPFANNGDMLVNMVDALGGSADLISLRSRGTYQRPFTRIDELEHAASDRLRVQQDALVQALNETERKIAELSKPTDSAAADAETGVQLTAEQQAEVMKFQQEKLRIRKNLRDVQRQLNEDVERLEMRIKLINLTAVPALLTLLALFSLAWRAYRARRD